VLQPPHALRESPVQTSELLSAAHVRLPQPVVPHAAPFVPTSVAQPPHAFAAPLPLGPPVQFIDSRSAEHFAVPQAPHAAPSVAVGAVPPSVPQPPHAFLVTQSTHLPVAVLHSGVGAEHCALLVHDVAQLPPTQSIAQTVPLDQLPVASQVCGVFPLHCLAPGTQTPLHTPAPVHTLQVDVVAHVPDALHVWESRPLQRDEPGTHSPAQAPAEQTNGQSSLSPHDAVVLHSCT
jgi:hypothetical protein